MSLIDAIFERCDVDPETGCWLSRLKPNSDGYIVITYERRQYSAHKEVLAWKLGHPVEGLALHTCDVRHCVNPDHLYDGTHKNNADDMIARGRGKNQFKAGPAHPSVKLTSEQVQEIRSAPKVRGIQKALAVKFGVHPTTISDIRTGRCWGHITSN